MDDEIEEEDCMMNLSYKLPPELEAERKELDNLIKQAEDTGFLFEVHLEPLAAVLSYLSSSDGKKDFYNLVSNPGEDSNTTIEILDSILRLYANRQETFFRKGLIQRISTIGSSDSYCVAQFLPLIDGSAVRGLEGIFGKDDSGRLSTDLGYIPLDKTYICCCHNMTRNRYPSRIFLFGDEEVMEGIIPDALKISDKISIENLCPYEADCPFKEAYKSSEGASLRIINKPLENALRVLQKRTESGFSPEVYKNLILAAEKINQHNDHLSEHESDPLGLNGRKIDTAYIY